MKQKLNDSIRINKSLEQRQGREKRKRRREKSGRERESIEWEREKADASRAIEEKEEEGAGRRENVTESAREGRSEKEIREERGRRGQREESVKKEGGYGEGRMIRRRRMVGRQGQRDEQNQHECWPIEISYVARSRGGRQTIEFARGCTYIHNTHYSDGIGRKNTVSRELSEGFLSPRRAD